MLLLFLFGFVTFIISARFIFFRPDVSMKDILIFIYLYLSKNEPLENGKTAELPYYLNNTKYKILFPTQKSITHITFNEDVYDECLEKINEYKGYYNNFHGISVTPSMIKCNKDLTIHYIGGRSTTYSPTENIVVNVVTLNSSRMVG